MIILESQIIERIIGILRTKHKFKDSLIVVNPTISSENNVMMPDVIVYKDHNHQMPLLIAEAKSKINPVAAENLFTYMKKFHIQYGMISDGSHEVFYEHLGSGNVIEIPYIPEKGKGQ